MASVQDERQRENCAADIAARKRGAVMINVAFILTWVGFNDLDAM
jgi:hypothetical protein